MAVIGGTNCRVLLDVYDISAYFNEASIARSCELQDVSTFGATHKAYAKTIEAPPDVVLTGFTDGDTATIPAYLNTLFANANRTVFSYGPNLTTIGNEAFFCNARDKSYGFKTATTAIIGLSANIQPSGPLYRGLWSHALGAETSAASSTASVNNVAGATTFGAAAVLHCTAGDFTTLTVKIRDSADDASFADIITFTQLTAVGAELKTLTGTIRQYTLTSWTRGGGSTGTFATALARLLA